MPSYMGKKWKLTWSVEQNACLLWRSIRIRASAGVRCAWGIVCLDMFCYHSYLFSLNLIYFHVVEENTTTNFIKAFCVFRGIMCISNEPCRKKMGICAALAQSTYWHFWMIGRMPISPGKRSFLEPCTGQAWFIFMCTRPRVRKTVGFSDFCRSRLNT